MTEQYKGSCHCGAIQFSFSGPAIDQGLRCNCSICRRKGAMMTPYVVGPDDMTIDDPKDQLGTYEFGTDVAKHHFCKSCGIYTFHQTMRMPGQYRVNLGCVEGLDTFSLPFDVFDGTAL